MPKQVWTEINTVGFQRRKRLLGKNGSQGDVTLNWTSTGKVDKRLKIELT